MLRNWRHWHKPHFWSWWWNERAGRDFKITLVLIGAIALVALGIGSAAWATPSDTRTITSVRTIQVVKSVVGPGETVTLDAKPVTVVETTRLPGRTKTLPGQVVTVQRAGKTVVIRKPGKTIRVPGPVRIKKSVVFKPVVKIRTKEKLVTITSPAVTLPGETISKTITVQEPGRTETETKIITVDKPVTVRETVTVDRPVTVTDTQTVTQTQTVTHTETETVTVTEPPPGQ